MNSESEIYIWLKFTTHKIYVAWHEDESHRYERTNMCFEDMYNVGPSGKLEDTLQKPNFTIKTLD